MRPDFSKARPNSTDKRHKAGKAAPKIPRLFTQKTIFGKANLSGSIWYTGRGDFSQFDALRSQKQATSAQRREICPPTLLSPHAVAEATIRLRILKDQISFSSKLSYQCSRGHDPAQDSERVSGTCAGSICGSSRGHDPAQDSERITMTRRTKRKLV